MILKSAIEWIHVCVEINSIQNVVKVSVNGGNISTMTGALKPTEERQLSMFIGLPPPDIRSSYPRQFIGMVSNINIYLFNTVNANNVVNVAYLRNNQNQIDILLQRQSFKNS